MSFPLERTLIIGASVSAAPIENNPVKRLLRKHGVLSGALVHARNGTPGRDTLASLDRHCLTNVSCVVTVDLFFWDSVFGSASATLAKMDEFFRELRRLQMPAIIGTVPEITPLQLNAAAINSALIRQASASERVHLLDLSALYERVRNRGLHMDGRLYPETELMPDGLHPSPTGAEFLSREIASVVLRAIKGVGSPISRAL